MHECIRCVQAFEKLNSFPQQCPSHSWWFPLIVHSCTCTFSSCVKDNLLDLAQPCTEMYTVVVSLSGNIRRDFAVLGRDGEAF